MATWQKVITSGSSAELAHVTASGGYNSPGTASFGDITGTISTATQAKVDHDSLLNFVANEHIDHSGVSVVAGTGLTGGGTIAANRTLNVIGGDGITANANDIAITAAQTTITSIFATDLKIGEDAQTAIDFETADQIHLDANNAQVVNIRAGGIEVTGDVTASIGIIAPTGSINHLMNVATINHDSAVNANLDFSSAGLLNLRSTNSATHALELFGGVNGAAIPHINTQTHATLGILVDDVVVMNLQKNKAVTLTGDVSASGIVSASGFTTPLGTIAGFSGSFGDVSASGTILAAKLDALAVSDALAAAIVAEIDNDEIPIAKLAEDAVTVTAGTGLTGAGAVTLGAAVTMNVIGGDGITANANDIAITAAQTTITSIFATDLKIGEDAQTAIDFETADQIHLDANNAQVVNVRAGGIEVTGDVTASAGIHAAAVISGSGFLTPLGTVSGFSGSFGDVSASGTILAAKLDAAAVSDTLAAAIVAEIDNDEIPIAKLAEDAVTVTAGTGLTGAGAVTLGAAVTMNVIGGDGITANANDVAITAAQTTITSVTNASLVVGRDADNQIKFGEDNVIAFRVGASDRFSLTTKGLITTDVSASGEISASSFVTPKSPAIGAGAAASGTGSFGHVTGSFAGEGSRLTNVTAAAIDIDGLTAFSGVPHATQDEFLISDNGTELRATMTMVANGAFALVSGDATVAAGGALTIANTAVETAMIADDAVDADKLAANAVVNASIASNAAIAHSKLAALAATKVLVGNGSNVATEVVLSGDVTMDNAGAVTIGATKIVNSMIGDGAVDTEELAADSVTAAKIGDNVINSEHYAAASIDNEHLADNAVGTDEIADDAVTAAKLASNAVVNASIASNAAIAHTKLAALAATKVLVGNGSNVATAVALSGDVTMNNAGAVTLGTVGANHITEISNLTAGEGAQLEAIGNTTISATQWGYVGALDQAVQTDSDVSFNNLNVDGNLVVAGTASFEETANLNVKDRFISLASGSAAGGDGGIVVNQALGNVPSGSAFGYEAGTADRWAVQSNFVPTGSAMVPDAYMGIVTFSTSAPSGNPQYGGANYGYGNIHVDTDDGEIYIFA